LPPPPLNPQKQKASKDCYTSYIDQIQGGLYSSSKLVRSQPRTTADSYFIVRTFKAEVRSYRRNYSHKSVALFRTKKDGATRGNIEYMTGSFLELDGSTDSTIKTQRDVFTLIEKNSLPKPSYAIETSTGNFHVIWNYDNPLPWTNKGESYWVSNQKRLIELFKRAGFNVDVGASLNPTQNLRNPSQLKPYNFKRRCNVFIHKSYQKTSLRAIYRALNKTSIPNPAPIRASVKLRRFERANQTFTMTYRELAKRCGVSERTIGTEVQKAIKNGDLRIVQRVGNNSEKTRTTQYESLIFIEKFPEVQLSISKNNSVPAEGLLRDFKQKGTSRGLRQKTIFALGLYLKARLGERASLGAIRAELEGGAMRSHVSEKEFERTLRNVVKPVYKFPFSLPKLRAWGLLKPERAGKSFLQ